MEVVEGRSVEPAKEGKEWSIKNRHHCVTTGEGALNRLNNKSEKKGKIWLAFHP